jgi:hypothetical protein
MTHASTLLDDIARGISATAPTAEQEALIEFHSAMQQQVLPQRHLFHRYRSDRKAPADTHGECLPYAA